MEGLNYGGGVRVGRVAQNAVKIARQAKQMAAQRRTGRGYAFAIASRVKANDRCLGERDRTSVLELTWYEIDQLNEQELAQRVLRLMRRAGLA